MYMFNNVAIKCHFDFVKRIYKFYNLYAVHMSDVVVVDEQESCPVYYTDLLTEGTLVILQLMLFYIAIQL